MVLGDVSLTAQEAEIFWLAKGWAKPGSAAGHQADFWLGANWPRENAVCLITVCRAQAEQPRWGPAVRAGLFMERCSTQSWTDAPARCHKAPSGQNSLCTHLPNQAPIRDPPSSSLLLCPLFCPTSIMKPQIKSAQCAILIKQKGENLSSSYI